ncbi:MAG TPA: cell surface protein SprA, partial [Flavobacteriales bacterium]|nr:cell surface protein SprA [Flavobacteriales bacterium]
SQEKGKKSEIDVKGGAQTHEFDIKADRYEENKHFFLSKYFHDNYEVALANLPLINSGINITKVEVWVTSRLGQTNNTRNIVAFMDLGEPEFHDKSSFISPGPETILPSASPFDTLYLDASNNLYEQMINSYPDIRDIYKVNATLGATPLVAAKDYEKVESARMLNTSEYKVNSQLGFISLNSSLTNDEVLGVAFQYTYNGKTYQVGEFSNNGISSPEALIIKLLKSTEINTTLPTWDLMMKNVYSIGSYNIQQMGFKFNVLYKDPDIGTPANYLKEGMPGIVKGVPLLEVFNLDGLNAQLDPQPDGVFDFINGVTINASRGRIYFPILEPFGQYLEDKITGLIDNGVTDPNLITVANKYTFKELYEMTRSDAQQEHPEKNRFSLVGAYQSTSSSEISLNAMNVPQGSVIVTAGGTKLTENVDYTVDYSLGRVKIINEGILNSGTPIKISFESNTLFNIQSKTLIGSRFDYKVSKDLNVGGTIMHLTERPITTKINIGDEPISNTIWGMDGDFRTQAPFLTKLVDALPLISTKAPSSFTVNGEFANLLPGHAKAVGKEGISYIDDFEGSRSTIDLKSISSWVLASTPQAAIGPGGKVLFPEASFHDSLEYGFNRAKLAWYVIDPIFSRDNSLTPSHIKDAPQQSNDYVREVLETELFPNKELPSGQPPNLAMFDVAFYPGDRGPYNYDVENLNSDGTFANPNHRWGGIMRSISTNDFEAANIEFVEFWMMDPFHNSQGQYNSTGGDLYFNLGSISEDVLKDGRKSYENGLPASSAVLSVDTTVWGRVPSQGQNLVDAFDNNEDARKFQDVGLDGLSNDDENTFFNEFLNTLQSFYTAKAYNTISSDPSSDRYHYFRGTDYDNDEVGILGRYYNYNGLEGNSPTTDSSPEDYPTSATTLPNKEDINRDNTLDEKESYYQYRVSLRPQDMAVGQNHITDVVTGTGKTKDGNPIDVKWYQFKIPIRKPERVVGTIQDFKSIRFVRMFLHDFSDTVICRFAKFGLVRSEWRKIDCADGSNCLEPGEYLADDDFDETTFDVSVVNIEENGTRTPVNYALPPGIEQEQDFSDPNLRSLNEQALSLKVCDLEDGHSRAAYKIVEFDIRSYKRMRMFVHAEDASSEGLLQDGDLTIFVRLGSDFTDNYYEYEIPLELTPWGTTNSNPELIWPETNHFNFEFNLLQTVKQLRNKENWSRTVRYPENGYADGKNLVYVKGNPDLSRLKTMMIGIRNPKKIIAGGKDDGQVKCAEIWVNELRLAGFDEKAGWAANTRMTAKLADLAIINLSGNMRTPGFGSIEKKVNERDRETTLAYDASSTVQLGRFVPDKIGLKVPMYVGYSEEIKKPQYNPLDPDILMKDAMENYDPNEQDSIKKIVTDYTKRKSINFTNVKKVKGKGAKKQHIYDIENLALTYAFTEDYHEDINTEFNTSRNHRGALSYNFSQKPKNIKPFSKVKALRKSKYLRLVRDFNFYLMPSRLSFKTDMNRTFTESKPRNTTGYDLLIDTVFAKSFIWNRVYDFKYDISRALKFDFTANNKAVIDEPDGRINSDWKKEQLRDSIYSFGRTTNYKHTSNASYTVPLNKIPLTDWLSATTRYGSTFDWLGAPLGLIDTSGNQIGNTIKNSNSKQLTGQANLVTLYNKVKYLKKINKKYSKRNRGKPKEPEYKTIKFEKTGVDFMARKPEKIYHNLETKDITSVEVYDSKGKKIKGKLFIETNNKITYELKTNLKNARIVVEAKKKRGLDLEKILELSARTAMAVKKVSVTYSEKNGTTLPGYLPRTKVIGQNIDASAPGYDFLFGYQPGHSLFFDEKSETQINNDREKWLESRRDLGWISKSGSQYNSFLQGTTQNLSLKATIEPIPGLRVDITANRNFTQNYSEIFRDTSLLADGSGWEHLNQMESGNFTISFFSLPTIFGTDDDNHISKVFAEFANKRSEVSDELKDEYTLRNPNVSNPSQANGFGNTSQEVLIPAFLEAYGGLSSSTVLFNPFIKMPKPNWRVTYDGLTKIPWLNKRFKKITIGHGYRSTFSISSFTTNLMYDEQMGENGEGYTDIIDINGNYLSRYEINQVVISEQLNPLIKINMTWKNSLITSAEFKKTRNLTMSFSNNQLTEVRGNEIIIGAGYRLKDLKLPIKMGPKRKDLQSDLNIKADFSIRGNTTIIRKLVEGTNTPLKGQRITSINFTADYAINRRFNIQAFYKRTGNKPFVSNLFNTSSSSAGITIRFQLAS